ncbi:MAG: phosphate/phosphite/phosphonate ABC transporter substrate-binding protein [Neptuniibacter sp.]
MLLTVVRNFALSLLIASILFQTATAQPLVIAQLSDRPKKDLKQLRPMVEYAAKELKSVGVTVGQVKLFEDTESLIAAIKSGEVHWVTETPYTAARLVHEAGAIPLLMKWKSRQKRYQTFIYTHKDSGIKSIADLIGKRIAFEHDDSFSSYFLPRMVMEKKGYVFNAIQSNDSELEADKINYVFSRNEKNNLLWVHKKLVEAGALNNGDWENSKRVPDSLKSDLRIIYRTDLYPRALELINPKLDPAIQSALKDFLLSLDYEDDRDVMHRYEKTTGFEEPIAELPKLLQEIYSYRKDFSE